MRRVTLLLGTTVVLAAAPACHPYYGLRGLEERPICRITFESTVGSGTCIRVGEDAALTARWSCSFVKMGPVEWSSGTPAIASVAGVAADDASVVARLEGKSPGCAWITLHTPATVYTTDWDLLVKVLPKNQGADACEAPCTWPQR